MTICEQHGLTIPCLSCEQGTGQPPPEKMVYKEIVIPGGVTVEGVVAWKSTPTYAIDINDFDSMALRLVRQLTRRQIDTLIQRAYDSTEWL